MGMLHGLVLTLRNVRDYPPDCRKYPPDLRSPEYRTAAGGIAVQYLDEWQVPLAGWDSRQREWTHHRPAFSAASRKESPARIAFKAITWFADSSSLNSCSSCVRFVLVTMMPPCPLMSGFRVFLPMGMLSDSARDHSTFCRFGWNCTHHGPRAYRL